MGSSRLQNDARDAKTEGHSPGPWGWAPCLDASGTYVASFDICLPSEPDDTGVGVLASVWGNEAHARLMAAAPELLAALIAARDSMALRPGYDLAEIDAAIAKALPPQPRDQQVAGDRSRETPLLNTSEADEKR